jgi:hypothetical protein
MSNQRKPDPTVKVLKRQILRSAASYTDEKIEELKEYLSNILDEDGLPDEDGPEDPDPDPGGPGGGGGGGGIGIIFPPDNPIPWVPAPLPERDITPVGTVTAIEFQKSDGTFEYDENNRYGYTYLSSDGGFTGSVTVRITGDGEIDDFELQVTKID